MKLRDHIRNFFYAATHASALIAARDDLSGMYNALYRQKEDLLKHLSQSETEKTQLKQSFQSAMQTVLPEDPTVEQLTNLYNSIKQLDPNGSTKTLQAVKTVNRYGFLGSFEKGAVELERIKYANTLVEMGVLPRKMGINQLNEETRRGIREELGADKLPSNMPVGKIEYLFDKGKTGDSLRCYDAAMLVEQIMIDNNAGEPMSITIYSDPATDAHIDTSWVLQMDPPPQGFQIIPYDPVADLTAEFTWEELAEELDWRIYTRVAIESTDDHTEPGFGQETVDVDIRNEDGSYGRVMNKYRIVTIGQEGNHLVAITRPFDSKEEALAAAQGNPGIRIVTYDELVHKAGANLGYSSITLNRFSTEQLQQAIERLDSSDEERQLPAHDGSNLPPNEPPVPEMDLELEM